jgi:HAD superfamily hydrolase (TIGR01484 family)
MKKINYQLIASDFDGTLLTSGQTLSDYTLKTVNSLAEKGLLFSYATARSYATSSIVAKGLYDALPVIVYNGTFILENGSKKKNRQFHSNDLPLQRLSFWQ